MNKDEYVDKIFKRGIIEEVLPSKESFVKRLLDKKTFHIYFGIDPTSDKLHLGHIANILLLEDLRKLGAKVTILFGTFTSLIGDPTDKGSVRPQLTKRDVDRNIKTWKKQIKPIIDLSLFSSVRIRKNSEWFDLFSAEDMFSIIRETTTQQLLERSMFQKRLKEGKPLFSHELLYPILQGYDSVALDVDAELCGTDQTFNSLMGRDFQKRYRDKEKFVITFKLIEADGVLMSKSSGTGVFIDIEKGGNHRMFGKIMSLPDAFIIPIYKACTRVDLDYIEKIKNKKGVELRDEKLKLAETIVSIFWGSNMAKRAKNAYILQFQENKISENAKKINLSKDIRLIEFIAKNNNVSNQYVKRKMKEGAVFVNNEKIQDMSFSLNKNSKYIVKISRDVYIINNYETK